MALIVFSFPSHWCLHLWTIPAQGLSLASAVTQEACLPGWESLSLNLNGMNRLQSGGKDGGVCDLDWETEHMHDQAAARRQVLT